MDDTETRLREALDNMFETACDNGHPHLEVTAQDLANAAEVEGKTGSIPLEAAQRVLSAASGSGDSSGGGTTRFALPR